jgi:ribosomal protein S18 acetylase RimI-like enzyme
MYYRSDWPEAGLPDSLSEQRPADFPVPRSDCRSWVQQAELCGALFRWSASPSEFESALYGLPVWNLHFEIEDPVGDVLVSSPGDPKLAEHVGGLASQILDDPPWGSGYVSAKVVGGEPPSEALLSTGFVPVEYRRLFRCKVRDHAVRQDARPQTGLWVTSLASVPAHRLESYREQVLDICRQAFGERGLSRHFTDPILLARLPGIVYIMALMRQNFEHVPLDRFLVAIDTATDEVCGFSAIGRKPGLGETTFTQLLSAVHKAYRGQGVYQGLTRLLSETLPQDATLLNVVQTGNRAIQRAYEGSGRLHLADTVVLRRVFDVFE